MPSKQRGLTAPEEPDFVIWTEEQLAALPGFDRYSDGTYPHLPSDDFLASLLAKAENLSGFVIFQDEGSHLAIFALHDDLSAYAVLIPTLPSIQRYWEVFGRIKRAVEPDWKIGAAIMPRGQLPCEFVRHLWSMVEKEHVKYHKTLKTEASLKVIGPVLVGSPWDHAKQQWDETQRARFTAQFATDGKHIYRTDKGQIAARFAKSDPASFRILSKVFAQDKDNIYVLGERVPGVDSGSFQIIHEDLQTFLYVFADKTGVWDGEKQMNGISPKGMAVLNRFYARNDFHIINLQTCHPISGADLDSFEILDDEGNARDNSREYYLHYIHERVFDEISRDDPYGSFRAGIAKINTRMRRS